MKFRQGPRRGSTQAKEEKLCAPILAAFAVSIALTGEAAWATDYSIENYDFPGAASSAVLGINAAGRVVGFYIIAGTPAGLRGTYFLLRAGAYSTITLPVPGASVAGIDNFGRLFGSYETHSFVATPKTN